MYVEITLIAKTSEMAPGDLEKIIAMIDKCQFMGKNSGPLKVLDSLVHVRKVETEG